MVRYDGQWLISNPARDSLARSEPPGAGLVELLQKLTSWAEQPRSRLKIFQWLGEQGLMSDHAEVLLNAFVDSSILVPEDAESPWSALATEYPSLQDVLRFISFRRSVRFVDYSDPDVFRQDRNKMEDFERSESPPKIYKHYARTPQVSLAHPATSPPYDAFTRLSHLLFWGYGRLREVYFHQLPSMLKSVPSMGARHPFEAYVLVAEDSVLDKGIYHYRVEQHTLEYIGEQPAKEQEQQKKGDTYEARAIRLVTTAIFDRFQWRYRHSWNYKDLYYDFGHVLATLKFVAAELGMALRDANAEVSLPGTAPLLEEILAVYRLECL